MRFINRPRGSGKTTMLINSAYITGYPIIVPTLAHKNFIIEKSKDMNCNNIEVYTIKEWEIIRKNKPVSDKVYVDDIESLLRQVLNEYLHAEVVAATLSLPMEQCDDINFNV